MHPILVIEDERAMRLLMQEYLELLGYPVLLAADGATAVALAGTEPISLAFVDINLPDMNGVEVIQRLRDLEVSCPLVILSGNLRESYADRITHLEVAEILEKPVDLLDMERVIQTLIGKAPGARASGA
jgi:DNA-binding response OmpR family regulator